MAFNWEKMRNTPLGKMEHEQHLANQKAPIDAQARLYERQAQATLAGRDGAIVKDELRRFGASILSAREGVEQEELLERFQSAVRSRRGSFFDDVADDPRERLAFCYALARVNERDSRDA